MLTYPFTASIAEPPERFYNPGNPDYLSVLWRARNTANRFVTSSTLSEEEFESLYNLTPETGSTPEESSLLTDLVAGWKGGTATDVTGRGNNLIATLCSVVSGTGITNDNAYYMIDANSGLNQNIATSDTLLYKTNFTVAMWKKDTSTDNTRAVCLLSAGSDASSNIYEFAYGSGDTDSFPKAVWYYPSDVSTLSNESIALSNGWQLLVLTYDKTNSLLSLYVNGVLSDSGSSTGTTQYNQSLSGAETFCIGNQSSFNDIGTYGLFGYLSDTYIWNRVITQNEINKLYNSGVGLTYPFTS